MCCITVVLEEINLFLRNVKMSSDANVMKFHVSLRKGMLKVILILDSEH